MSVFFSCFYKKPEIVGEDEQENYQRSETGALEVCALPRPGFKHFNDLFPELRGMIIDEMDICDRCRFTRCSKLCNKEVKTSKNYIHSLILDSSVCSTTEIVVLHEKCDFKRFGQKGYRLKFRDYRRNKYLACQNGYQVTLWKEELDISTKLVRYAVEHFKQLLDVYQNKIKELRFIGITFNYELKRYDFGIRNLNSLQVLEIHGDMDILGYFSKLRRPLKHLTVHEGENSKILPDCEEIYKVTDHLSIVGANLTYEQMLRLPASVVHISFGDISEQQICNFIKSWQNGTHSWQNGTYTWTKSKSRKFDIRGLLQLVGLTRNVSSTLDAGDIEFEIEHCEKTGRKASLYTSIAYTKLIFAVEK